MPFDVFLSHHSSDKPWAIALKSALTERGVSVWLDKDEIRPGDLFIDALEQGIQNSRAVAIIVSPESLRSAWVKEEYHRALTLATSRPGFRVIPCLLRRAELPGFMASRECVDFQDPSAFQHRVDDLSFGITGRRAVRTAALESPAVAPELISDAQIAFLQCSIENAIQERRAALVVRACAPACGAGVSALWPSLTGLPLPLHYLSAALVTGLIGFGVTQKKWTRLGSALKRQVIYRDALTMCRQSRTPLCSDIALHFDRFVKDLIGIADQVATNPVDKARPK